MSGDNNFYLPGKKAEAATVEPYHFVVQGTDSDEVALAGAGENVLGVCENDPGQHEAVRIVCGGITRLIVNGNSTNIAVGDFLKSDASGEGVKADTDEDRYGAMALEAATADNLKIRVLVCHGTISTS